MKQKDLKEKKLIRLRKLCQSFASKVKNDYGFKTVISEITEYDISVSLYSLKGNLFLGSIITNVNTFEVDMCDGIAEPLEPFGSLFARCAEKFKKC